MPTWKYGTSANGSAGHTHLGHCVLAAGESVTITREMLAAGRALGGNPFSAARLAARSLSPSVEAARPGGRWAAGATGPAGARAPGTARPDTGPAVTVNGLDPGTTADQAAGVGALVCQYLASAGTVTVGNPSGRSVELSLTVAVTYATD